MKWAFYLFVLAPLVRRNYALREAGKRHDEWYWAELLALRFGYIRSDDPKAYKGGGA